MFGEGLLTPPIIRPKVSGTLGDLRSRWVSGSGDPDTTGRVGEHKQETRFPRSTPDVKRRELAETGCFFAALGRHGPCVIWGGSVVRTPIVGEAVGVSVGVGVDVAVGDRVTVAGPRYRVKLTESQGL